MIRPNFPKTLVLAACVCSVLGSQTAFSETHRDHDHEHDHAAPPPPSERRTRVDTEQLAEFLTAQKNAQKPAAEIQLPALPEGVVELGFQEFFQNPVGPRGLEPSAKLLSLSGKRVRILGFVAEMKRDNKRNIIFAPVPLKPQPEEYGLADEIPAAHVLVTIPGDPDTQVPLVPGALLLTGTLAVGNSTKDGETSFVRMLLDPSAEADAGTR
ncbi:hypothetical protein HQ447_14820 [bacterium]|nr:hypothetical protein [bacterium]